MPHAACFSCFSQPTPCRHFWLSSRANVSLVTAQTFDLIRESVCDSANGNDPAARKIGGFGVEGFRRPGAGATLRSSCLSQPIARQAYRKAHAARQTGGREGGREGQR